MCVCDNCNSVSESESAVDVAVFAKYIEDCQRDDNLLFIEQYDVRPTSFIILLTSLTNVLLNFFTNLTKL